MEDIQYIRIHGLDLRKHLIDHPRVQEELNIQSGNKELRNDNLILAVIRHTFDNTQLPIELDYLFEDKNNKNSESVKINVRGSFNNNGTNFHTKLWQGYNHIAIMEVDNPNSQLIRSIKSFDLIKRWDPTFILCKSEDSRQCKVQLEASFVESENHMKKNNRERWEFLRKEEMEYKKKHQ